MLNRKFLSALFAALCMVSLSMGQTADISPARKQAIDSLALEKVRDLSKYISIIGNKKRLFQKPPASWIGPKNFLLLIVKWVYRH